MSPAPSIIFPMSVNGSSILLFTQAITYGVIPDSFLFLTEVGTTFYWLYLQSRPGILTLPIASSYLGLRHHHLSLVLLQLSPNQFSYLYPGSTLFSLLSIKQTKWSFSNLFFHSFPHSLVPTVLVLLFL